MAEILCDALSDADWIEALFSESNISLDGFVSPYDMQLRKFPKVHIAIKHHFMKYYRQQKPAQSFQNWFSARILSLHLCKEARHDVIKSLQSHDPRRGSLAGWIHDKRLRLNQLEKQAKTFQVQIESDGDGGKLVVLKMTTEVMQKHIVRNISSKEKLDIFFSKFELSEGGSASEYQNIFQNLKESAVEELSVDGNIYKLQEPLVFDRKIVDAILRDRLSEIDLTDFLRRCRFMAAVFCELDQATIPRARRFLQLAADAQMELDFEDTETVARKITKALSRTDHVVGVFKMRFPKAWTMPRSIGFIDALNDGIFDKDLLACMDTSSCEQSPAIQHEFKMCQKVESLLSFLRGRLTSEEMRMTEVARFQLSLMAGSFDKSLKNVREPTPATWLEEPFILKRIGGVLRQTKTFAMDTSQAEDKIVDRRVRQKTEFYHKTSLEQLQSIERLTEQLAFVEAQITSERKSWSDEKHSMTRQQAKDQEELTGTTNRLKHLESQRDSAKEELSKSKKSFAEELDLLRGVGLSGCSLDELDQLQSIRIASLTAHQTEMLKRAGATATEKT